MDVVTGGVNITAASPVTLWDGFKISHGTFDNGTSSTFTPFPDYKTGVFVG